MSSVRDIARRTAVYAVASAAWAFMAAMALCLLLGLMAGCRSQRQTKETISIVTDSTAVHEADTKETHSADLNVAWGFEADAIWGSFEADSIVTARGDVIYRPQFTGGADKPKSNGETALHTSDDLVRHEADSTHTAGALEGAKSTASDATAVAKPPNAALWLLAAILLCSAAILLRRSLRRS